MAKVNANERRLKNERIELLTDWLQTTVAHPLQELVPLTGDASFRRYFRVRANNTSYIAMDAPPEKENCRPYVAIAKALSQLGLRAPTVFASDFEQGFLLLTDFGDCLLLNALNNDTVDHYYQKAFEHLLILQTCSGAKDYKIHTYNDGLYSYYEEMSWFVTWYLEKHKDIHLTAAEQTAFDQLLQKIAASVEQQPQVFVHRDYHSRNLMVVDEGDLGVLDFQDAVWGPVTYDLMSLLRDCYIDWPRSRVERWVRDYQLQAISHGIIKESSAEQFLQWFDWAGLQRNLKCIGLFVRLNLRDNKPGYMQDIPRVVSYVKQVANKYSEFTILKTLIERAESVNILV